MPEFKRFPEHFIEIFHDPDYRHSIAAEDAARKFQVQYLWKYLTDISCQHLLIESEYVDHDYLDDYANYYAKCFSNYRRFCKRVHFFRAAAAEIDLQELIIGHDREQVKKLQQAYLGFVVIKPLPQAVVGRTVLETYDDDYGRRHFPATRWYDVNLYGISLRVRSLASQEQDTVLAACATSALWSTFQKTAVMFDTFVPTPTEITKAATKYVQVTRPIPTHGLNAEQMCYAVSEGRLVPEVYQVNEDLPVNSLIYSYVKAGIPVLLGYAIVENDQVNRHAVAITGFRLETDRMYSSEVVSDDLALNLRGGRISELYANDDNLGPFSRLICNEIQVGAGIHNKRVFKRQFSFEGTSTDGICVPDLIIVPIYHKIRLRMTDVRMSIKQFEEYLRQIGALVDENDNVIDIEWDIRLITISELKDYVVDCEFLDAETKRRVVMQNLPKYSWLSSAYVGGFPLLSVISDATDMERSFYFDQILFYGASTRERLSTAITQADEELTQAGEAGLSQCFKRFIREKIVAAAAQPTPSS